MSKTELLNSPAEAGHLLAGTRADCCRFWKYLD